MLTSTMSPLLMPRSLAVLGPIWAGLSQVTFVMGSGVSCSQPLLA